MKCSPVLCTNVLQVQCTYVLLYSNQPIQTCKYLPVGQALTKHHIRRIKAAILYQDDFEEQDEFISFFKSSWYLSYSSNSPNAQQLAQQGNGFNSDPQQKRRPLPLLLYLSFFYVKHEALKLNLTSGHEAVKVVQFRPVS